MANRPAAEPRLHYADPQGSKVWEVTRTQAGEVADPQVAPQRTRFVEWSRLKIRAILWDMDGVLADTGEAHFVAWRRMFAEQGRALTREQFAQTFGMANPEILGRWLGEGVPREQIDALAARKEALFRDGVAEVRLLPGTRDWLGWARARGIRQVVASSGEMANIAAIVAALEIGNYFDALVSGAFLPRSKPDPAVFLQAAGAAGVAPGECLVIEDGIVGIEAARRAGMRCLALTTTHPAERLTLADWVAGSLADLDEEAFDQLVVE